MGDLWGEYDEVAARNSFRDAVTDWRASGASPTVVDHELANQEQQITAPATHQRDAALRTEYEAEFQLAEQLLADHKAETAQTASEASAAPQGCNDISVDIEQIDHAISSGACCDIVDY
eukprot:SAG31_NODE_3185_length_4579_cov_2.704911_7_plen_119_part_00